MCKIKILLIIAFILSVTSASSALNILYVDVHSPNNPGSGTFDDPFRKIQDGINTANAGDIVEIRPGLYIGQGNYGLDPNGKSITIRSTDPNNPDVVAQTIIDPNKNGRGFNFWNGEDANCIIAGLTIRNGYSATEYDGGNIYCYNSCPTIRNCIIKDGYATGSGGGIYFDCSNASIINCTITDNRADYYGGGISSAFCDPVIINCIISGNTAGREGGGIDSGQSDPNIFNCIIIDNNAPLGGGINCYFPGVANVVNCTLVANSANDVGGAVHCWSEGSANIKNSILWANSAIDGTQLGIQEEGSASVTYCDVQGGQTNIYDPCEHLIWDSGNIDNDPCFASFDSNGNPNLWDFHLQSTDGRWNSTFYRTDLNNDGTINLVDFAELAGVWLQQGSMPEDLNRDGTVDWMDMELFTQYYLANSDSDGWVSDTSTSPCIDAGDPNSDWSSEPWPNGKRINMGAYGGTSQASKNGNPGNFNLDDVVNFKDFGELANKWLLEGAFFEDLNSNGTVDAADLGLFAENWLWQRE